MRASLTERFAQICIAEVGARKVRAFQPDPVAWCELGELRVKIHKGRVLDHAPEGSPGDIIAVNKKGISVTCGEGCYLIERIQLPLGKGAVMTGADVLNGRTDIVHPGARLT